MVFIRRKRKGNGYYYELVETTREKEKVVQRVIEYFDSLEAANLYCEKKGIRKFETKYLISPETSCLTCEYVTPSLISFKSQIFSRYRHKWSSDLNWYQSINGCTNPWISFDSLIASFLSAAACAFCTEISNRDFFVAIFYKTIKEPLLPIGYTILFKNLS